MVGEDVEDDVLRGATGVEFAHQFEADGFGDLDEGEAGADEVRVLGRAHAIGQRVGGAAHAGVAVRGLNEIAHFDEFLARHLMADAGRDAVDGAVIAHAGVDLEGLLQVAQHLHLVHEGDEARVVVGVQQVVLEDRELVRIGQGVVLAVDFAQEGVDLRGREFVGIAALHAGDHRVVRLDALPLRLTDQVARDDLLGHGHRPGRRGQGGQIEFARRKALGEGEESTFLEDEARHRIVA